MAAVTYSVRNLRVKLIAGKTYLLKRQDWAYPICKCFLNETCSLQFVPIDEKSFNAD